MFFNRVKHHRRSASLEGPELSSGAAAGRPPDKQHTKPHSLGVFCEHPPVDASNERNRRGSGASAMSIDPLVDLQESFTPQFTSKGGSFSNPLFRDAPSPLFDSVASRDTSGRRGTLAQIRRCWSQAELRARTSGTKGAAQMMSRSRSKECLTTKVRLRTGPSRKISSSNPQIVNAEGQLVEARVARRGNETNSMIQVISSRSNETPQDRSTPRSGAIAESVSRGHADHTANLPEEAPMTDVEPGFAPEQIPQHTDADLEEISENFTLRQTEVKPLGSKNLDRSTATSIKGSTRVLRSLALAQEHQQ